MRYAITYVSTAASNLSDSVVDEILNFSKGWNNDHNITGLLLYSEGNFLQIIEGEKTVVQNLFDTIQKDERHKNILKIFEKEINRESFDGYDSEFVTDNTRHNPLKMEKYLDHIQVLDPSTQKAVRNILALFLNNN